MKNVLLILTLLFLLAQCKSGKESIVEKKESDFGTGSKLIVIMDTDADLYVDDKKVASLKAGNKWQSDINPGSHKIAVVKGNDTWRHQVATKSGEENTLQVFFTEAMEGSIKLVNEIAEQMVLVDGGVFEMGKENAEFDEKPVHKVKVNDFYLAKYELSNRLYCIFLNENWNQNEGTVDWVDLNSKDVQIEFTNGRFRPKEGFENHAVLEISWYGAHAFCAWLSKKSGLTYRLPYEAEWEYAARGGKYAKGYTFSGGNDIGNVAWYYYNSDYKTHPVGTKRPNELGIHDMSGGVWEWCTDWYAEDYYSKSPYDNPKGAESGDYKVLRGGCWGVGMGLCGVEVRDGSPPEDRDSHYGFRLARSK
jgi:formylglycine-generating enzyme